MLGVQVNGNQCLGGGGRGDNGHFAQVQVDGDDFSRERHDGACGCVECADDFPGTVAYGHGCGGDDVVVGSELVKVAGFAHDDVLRYLKT